MSTWDVLRMDYAEHMATSLRASLAGVEPTPPTLRPPRWRIQNLGLGRAQVNWGPLAWAGSWVHAWALARIRRALPTA
jgi:hypothetical protein